MEQILGILNSDTTFLLLFLAGFTAGIVDTIAGGGGLITVPSLLLAGVPPLIALGTNRLQASMGEFTASINFFLRNKLNVQLLPLGLLSVAIGAGAGSYAISVLSADFLKVLLPIMMVLITIYSIFSKRLRENTAGNPKMKTSTFMIVCGLSIGFYNGFFGPGVGSIWILACIILLGFSIKNASISSKPLNLMGNIVSLIFFIYVGTVNYKIGIIMGFGQIFGATLGSHIVIKNGDKIVRPVFIMVTSLMTIKLIWQNIPHNFLSVVASFFSHENFTFFLG
jgi:uncharacterized protein